MDNNQESNRQYQMNNNFVCSVCSKTENLTMIQGTVICTACLNIAKQQAKASRCEDAVESLGQEIANTIKEGEIGDIYD